MTILGRDALWAKLRSAENRLVVTPLLNPDEQLGHCSLDVRLGPEFIVLRRSGMAVLDLGDRRATARAVASNAHSVYVPFQSAFVLHPGELVLGATLEYVSLPTDLGCSVVGRSSFGRAGLVIATATNVDPGFAGCITLEIENLGQVPIKVFPGVRIAQLVFFGVSGAPKYAGRYRCPTGPEMGRLLEDRDLELFCSHQPG